jgi:hypothetical protein
MDLGVRLRFLAIRASLLLFQNAVGLPFGRTLRRLWGPIPLMRNFEQLPQ